MPGDRRVAGLIALVALLAGAAEAAPSERVDPIETFRQVCMEGQARFRKGAIAEITRRQVPPTFQWTLNYEKFDRYFLSANRWTLVAIGKPGEHGQLCSVRTVSVDTRRIYELGFPRLASDKRPPFFDREDVQRTIQSSYGYDIVAYRSSDTALILTTVILSPEAADKAKAALASTKPVKRFSNGSYVTTTTTATEPHADPH